MTATWKLENWMAVTIMGLTDMEIKNKKKWLNKDRGRHIKYIVMYNIINDISGPDYACSLSIHLSYMHIPHIQSTFVTRHQRCLAYYN